MSELGREKKRINLINAAAALRRKNYPEALQMLKNLLACHGAANDAKLAWNQREELLDFYSVFAAQVCELTVFTFVLVFFPFFSFFLFGRGERGKSEASFSLVKQSE